LSFWIDPKLYPEASVSESLVLST